MNINKTNKDKGVDKGEPKTGTDSSDHIKASATKQLGQSSTIAPKKGTRPASKSPEEVQRPPLKRHNKSNTMAAPMTSTTKSDRKEKENLSDLAELENRLLAGFASMIKKEIEPLKQDIKEIKEEQRLNIPTSSLGSCEAITRKFNQMDEKHRKLQDRISFLEDQLLEKNVIFQGILELEYEDIKDIKTGVVKAIVSTMTGESEEERKTNAGQTSMETVERMGKYNLMRTRPVKVKFSEKKDVDYLFKNRKKLPKGIYIDKEYSKSTEKECRLLRPMIKAARRLNKYKGVCHLEGPQLVIEGKRYHRHNIHTLPEDIQWKKANFCSDKIAMERILNCEDAADCKEVSRDIVNLDRKGWIDSAESLCFDGIQAKFQQKGHLMERLLDTGDKTLVEASYDEAWGTGQHLGSRDCLVKSKWKSIGILGRILMRIRSEAQTGSMEESISGNMDTANPLEPVDNTHSGFSSN